MFLKREDFKHCTDFKDFIKFIEPINSISIYFVKQYFKSLALKSFTFSYWFEKEH